MDEEGMDCPVMKSRLERRYEEQLIEIGRCLEKEEETSSSDDSSCLCLPLREKEDLGDDGGFGLGDRVCLLSSYRFVGRLMVGVRFQAGDMENDMENDMERKMSGMMMTMITMTAWWVDWTRCEAGIGAEWKANGKKDGEWGVVWVYGFILDRWKRTLSEECD